QRARRRLARGEPRRHVTAGGDEVADIFVWRGRLDDTHTLGGPTEALSDLGGVLASGLVCVGDDDHHTPDEHASGLVGDELPFAGSARVRRREEFQALEGRDVLFALDDVDDLALVCSHQLRKAVERAPYAARLPDPFAADPASLTEVLSGESHDLEQ